MPEDWVINTSRKSIVRVLKNGPSIESEKDKQIAAYLIESGLADGTVQRNYTEPGNKVNAISWKGCTKKGADYISETSLAVRILLNPWTVALGAVLFGVAVSVIF